ncbi:hypothetical protein O181_013718 [Austropuccinia psidii MF-1]|uniref:Uncharacterized protein n=1 Tax=Austropuccinia psidii MF-1 TaxID=1389203 RepID=A0A9Q3BZ82_9BASI|nr:hypothetical protein [Austropuccinia psidii MF-1]
MRARLIKLGYSYTSSTFRCPKGAGAASVPSDSPSSTEFSSSFESYSPKPLIVVLELTGKAPTTPENKFESLGPLHSFLDGASPSIIGAPSKLIIS